MQVKKKSILVGCLLLGTALFIVSCGKSKFTDDKSEGDRKKTTQLQKLEVSPAFKNIDVAYKTFGIKPGKAEKIIIKESGTVIEIPANAFVDDKGNTVTEKVDINFREFHDAAEIIASGIPMHNPETGEYMETAGMFEIKGLCKGKEIFIAPDKKIKINLASYNKGDRFDFFKLDENGRWETKQKKGKSQINLSRVEELKKIDSKINEKPIEPSKFDEKSKFVFNLDTRYIISPEQSVFRDVIWQFAGKATDTDNPENMPYIFETKWTNIDIKKEKSHYKLILSNYSKKVEIRVVPVLKGNDYAIAKKDFDLKIKEFQKIQKDLAQLQKMYEQQAEILRTYEISGFGIYNCDFWKGDSDIRLEASIDFEKEFDYAEKLGTVKFFLINNNRKAVVSFNIDKKGCIENFVFPSNEKNLLIAVLPGNSVAVFSSEDFKNLENKRKGDKVTLKMKTAEKTINAVEDISKIIAMY
jgi:hypothetical protein